EDVISLPSVLNRSAPKSVEDTVSEALEAHGAPRPVIDRLLHAVRGGKRPEARLALADALTTSFGFEPLPVAAADDRPIALVGPPGAGKTITIAKLAARAALADRPVKVITTDGFRAGGVDQLAAFTKLLEIDLHKALSIPELKRRAQTDVPGELVLIDTAGINPFSPEEIRHLSTLVSSVDAEPVLTMAAGGDAADAMEIGALFGAIGVRRLLVTRLDAARRLGAILAAADGGGLSFSNVSVSAHVARGFHELKQAELSRLLLSDPSQSALAFTFDEASL
ncbi:MAG: GTP-binding protein, partial [Proteobacteria bacterium]|nr:GTP-binding protein [Pseudomonadota bacterium]